MAISSLFKIHLMIMNYKRLHTKIGDLHLYADDGFLIGIFFKRNKILDEKLKGDKSNFILDKAESQILGFLEGKINRFSIPTRIEGTEFQKKAWKSLLKIPYGKTITYQEQASSMLNHKAVRAVGTANGKNQFPIIIPCHRVINKSGQIGNYSGGVKIKKALLDLEKKNRQSKP